jgi:hypothetical protein
VEEVHSDWVLELVLVFLRPEIFVNIAVVESQKFLLPAYSDLPQEVNQQSWLYDLAFQIAGVQEFEVFEMAHNQWWNY